MIREFLAFHGRYQPPHIGHKKLIETFIKDYPQSIPIVILDNRDLDDKNPFTIEERMKRFKMLLSKDVYDKINFTSTYKHAYPEDNIEDGIRVNYIALTNLINGLKAGWEQGEITIVRGEFDQHVSPRVAKAWNFYGANVIFAGKRFYNISSTKIRKSLKKINEKKEK